MGSLVQAMRNVAGVDNPEQIKERMELLLVAAKAKILGYKDEINENFMNPAMVDKIQIPGIRAIRFIEQYHVASKSKFNEQVTDHVQEAITAFFSIGGKDTETKSAVKSGIQSLISGALDGFLGSTEAGESEERIYIVVPENNAFIRADICVWKYHLTDNALGSNTDTAVAYVLCKSVIDHTKLTIDELIYLASETLAARKQMALINPDLVAAQARLSTAENKLEDAKKLPKTSDSDKKKSEDSISSAEKEVEREKNILKNLPPIVRAQENGEALRKGGNCVPYTIDANNPMAASPPNMAQVEAYIEEMIRVWNKLKESRA